MESWSPRHQHRRSSSWCGSGALPPDLRCLPDTDANADGDTDTGQLSLNPLSLRVSEPTSNRNRLINRIRHGAGMKLDLDAVKDWRDSNDAGADGDAELRLRKERLATSDKECSCILPYLFLSGQTVAQNLSTLQDSRITHIINCVGFVCPEYFPYDFAYRTLWLQDSPSEDIMCVLYDVFDYIEKAREQSGGRVLLHCCQGVSRSAALTIAYLMWRKSESFEDAFYEVKSKRDVVSPNMGFVSQLMQWQRKIFASPDRDTCQIYRIASHSPYDPLYLVPKSTASGGIEVLDSRGAFVIRSANVLYIWKGRRCDKEMVAVADHAAFQLVRYERAQGPRMLVREDSESTNIPQGWAQFFEKLEGHTEGVDGKQVSLYDYDFELYRKAKVGMYVPPVIGSGVIINPPTKREKWTQLHGSPIRPNG